MAEVRDGDVARFDVLFERHHARLYNFFLRLTGRPGTSEDLVQEAFLRMLTYRSSYRATGPFTAWMYRIARNVFADHLRDAVPLRGATSGGPGRSTERSTRSR